MWRNSQAQLSGEYHFFFGYDNEYLLVQQGAVSENLLSFVSTMQLTVKEPSPLGLAVLYD